MFNLNNALSVSKECNNRFAGNNDSRLENNILLSLSDSHISSLSLSLFLSLSLPLSLILPLSLSLDLAQSFSVSILYAR